MAYSICPICSSRIIHVSVMLPEIYTMEKCDFLKSMIHSQIIEFPVLCISFLG